MNYLITILQIIVGVSILNVWLIQFNKATRWRGGTASTMLEEFDAYGLPRWSCYVIGTAKVVLAMLLLAAIAYPILKTPAAIGLSALLTGSILMHLKIRDPLIKSLPAFTFLALSLIIAFSDSLV